MQRNPLTGSLRGYGSTAPDRAFAIPMSLALMNPPLTFRSCRKFVASTAWPEEALVWLISVAFTPPVAP